MDEFDIEVIGAKQPRKRGGRIKRFAGSVARAVRAMLMRPRILVLAGTAAFALFVGTPHAGWDYQCRHPMRSGKPCQSVRYCAYYGIQGRRVEFPEYGKTCRLITFLPPDWNKLMGERK
ncbi:hypothetical protein [Microbaculum marinisediminis]|uniref:Secreted protein n=1 Tax=Microbaculum marinisediminis TaxID=2931392 RepID=A0AAW5QS63_9HYPH|nr:hypothetical protein [Microbaculum sp. A6E488]MCT8970800.1 hypothetical protein [Microbaculum sp. A6E488]